MIAARRLLSLIAVAATTLVAPTALAQGTPPASDTPPSTPPPNAGSGAVPGPSSENRALAETLFFTARGMMEAGRYTDACPKLAESYRLDPAAGTLLNLAVCHQKVGKIASAWGEFRQAMADARKSNRPDREKLASDAVSTIEPELPYLTITVPDQVRKIKGLVISLNGVPLNAAAWSTELPVDPGEVRVDETAPDYKPKTLKVTVANKQHSSIAAEGLELAPVFRPPPPYWTAKRTWGVILFGTGLAAAGVGTYFGINAINQVNNSNGACPNDQAGAQRCTQTGVNDMNNANTSAWVADFTIGAGAVAGVIGAYLFLTGGENGPEGSAPPPPAAAWNWTVNVAGGPHAASGVLSTTF